MTRFKPEDVERLSGLLRVLADEHVAKAKDVVRGAPVDLEKIAESGSHIALADVMANAAEALNDFSRTLKGARP